MAQQPPDTIHVTPREGYIVRDPVTLKALPAEGRRVVRTSFWARRLRDGDVTLGKPGRSSKDDK
jgi:hypothetical protein